LYLEYKTVSVAFDTLKFARALRDKAHLPAEQAESIAEAFGEATGEQLVTKADLRDVGADLRAEGVRQGAKVSDALAAHDSRFVKIEGELALLKWMVGFNLAATVGVLFCSCGTDVGYRSTSLQASPKGNEAVALFHRKPPPSLSGATDSRAGLPPAPRR
jgi:hypothetical protein